MSKNGTFVDGLMPNMEKLMLVYPNAKLKIGQAVPGVGIINELLIGEEAGEGAYGKVWSAIDPDNGAVFAFEHVDLAKASNHQVSRFVMRLSQKIESQVESSFIPKSYGLVRISDTECGLLHQFIRGRPINLWIPENHGISWSIKRQLFYRICAGIKDYHLPDNLMENISLDNILIGDGEIPFLLDAGLPRYADRLISDAAKNSFIHPAPEKGLLVRDAAKNPEKQKIFELGCLLYGLIKGEPYWIKAGLKQPDFQAMIINGELKNSNILETFHPTFTHTAEEAIQVLQRATVFNPNARNLNLDEILKLFDAGEIPLPEVESTLKKEIEPSKEKFSSKEEKSEEMESFRQEKELSRGAGKKRSQHKLLRTIFILLLLAGAIAIGNTLVKKWYPVRDETTMEDQVAWNSAVSKNTVYFYLEYIRDHPDGKYLDEAKFKLNAFEGPLPDLSTLGNKRYTGKIEQFDDKQVISLRFEEFQAVEKGNKFTCSVNVGPVRKELSGMINSSGMIQFDKEGEGSNLNLREGRIYDQNGKIFMESVELAQYWILE